MFPITVDSGDRVVGAGKYMRGIAMLDKDGTVKVRVHTFNHVKFKGFTGGAVVVLSGADAGILWTSDARSFGVDGQMIPFKISDRWDDLFVGRIDPQTVARVDRVDVLLGLKGRNRLGDIAREVLRVGKICWKAYQEFIEWLEKQREVPLEDRPWPEGAVVLHTRTHLLAAAEMTAKVTPREISHRQPTRIRVTAEKGGIPVHGEVWTSLTRPVGRGGTLLGATNEEITATLEGVWVWRDFGRRGQWTYRAPQLVVVAEGRETSIPYQMTNLPPAPPPKDDVEFDPVPERGHPTSPAGLAA